ncbi:type VI secretion system Vgr family protein [Paracoccus halophilus]|uniref:type VI secretion system Vgr family protein n=1 Tax=Paracoccus halophilus TaxID=376733 RepID=UPI0009DD4D03|nr:type VI secretion system tip protein TssI/VgrG [Paracoccus halophilus]
MNAPYSQVQRLGRLTTVLGADALVLLRFDGADHVNELFEYRVEALAASGDVDFDALMGSHATVTVEGARGRRHFDGIVTQGRWLGAGENGHRYDLVLRPWFWLAGRRRNLRIFHNQTVVQILRALFSDYATLGDPALELKLSEDYRPLEYTVQFRESDLDFARRQMQRAGISFHFRHEAGSHTLVLTDDVLAHPSIGERPYKGHDGHHQAEEEHFWEWAPERNLTSGAVRLTDYNFKTPAATMEADRLGDATHAQGQIESFDWPGDYQDQDQGRAMAGLRLRQERGADRRNRAAGDCLSLGAGMLVSLAGDPVPGTGERYLCLSARYRFVSEAYGSGGPGGEGYAFSGSYTMMPDSAPMAPPRRIAAPLVSGPQTAFVVGEGEIDCDEYGRILVRFHWDLEGANSMRCRVSQNWAGNGWGGMSIPRIGMEVVVEFLDGDPDKPLVTGCLFNGQNAPPYELPAARTRTVWRSNTHQGQGFNEISFEDQAGREQVYLHAQRDHETVIGHDQSHQIGHDRRKTVGNDQTENVGGNKTITIGRNHAETIGADKVLSVGGDHAETIGGNMGLTVTGARAQTVTGDDATTVTNGDHSVTVANGKQEVRVLAAGRYTTVNNDIVTISETGGVRVRAATAVVLDAPSIMLKANDTNYILIAEGRVVIEGAETFINPRERAPNL